jgi:hypothetical protein
LAISAPQWLDSPLVKWLDCSVEGYVEPNQLAVQIQVNGHGVAAVVQKDSVVSQANPPAAGRVRVVVVARLERDQVLADLPASPLNGTQRIAVLSSRLAD